MSPQSSTPPVVIAKKTTRARRQSLALARSRRSSPPPNPNPPTTNPTSRASLSRVVVVRARRASARATSPHSTASSVRARARAIAPLVATRSLAFPRARFRTHRHHVSLALVQQLHRHADAFTESRTHVVTRSSVRARARDARSAMCGRRSGRARSKSRGDAFRRARRRGLARVPRHGSE